VRTSWYNAATIPELYHYSLLPFNMQLLDSVAGDVASLYGC